MGFDSSGTYTRLRGNDSWKGDAAAHTPIRADLHDNHDTDIANALSACLNRNGLGGALANLSMGGFKLLNMATPLPGDPASQAATKGYVDNLPGWSTAKEISGADANGRLNFSNPNGVNGISWTSIGAFWGARKAATDRARNRVVLNNAVDATGTDVLAIDETDGAFQYPGTHDEMCNLINDGTSWRTPVAGQGSLWRKTVNALTAYTNWTATTLAHGVAAINVFFSVSESSGNALMELRKEQSGNAVQIKGRTGSLSRWDLNLGNGTAEATDSSGSDFSLVSYNHGGTANFVVMSADRKTGRVDFPQGTSGDFKANGPITSTQQFNSSTTTAILSSTGGSIFLRPDGPASAAGQNEFTSAGYLKGQGIWEKAGTSGGYGTQVYNFYYVSDVDNRCYIGSSLVGRWTSVCDYRIKRNIQPLPSTWEAVKLLRPVRYNPAAYGDGDAYQDSDEVRWGFVAHELQEALVPSAAIGDKDGPDLQGPNIMAVLAATTAALQEAMLRIEALEARP